MAAREASRHRRAARQVWSCGARAEALEHDFQRVPGGVAVDRVGVAVQQADEEVEEDHVGPSDVGPERSVGLGASDDAVGERVQTLVDARGQKVGDETTHGDPLVAGAARGVVYLGLMRGAGQGPPIVVALKPQHSNS